MIEHLSATAHLLFPVDNMNWLSYIHTYMALSQYLLHAHLIPIHVHVIVSLPFIHPQTHIYYLARENILTHPPLYFSHVVTWFNPSGCWYNYTGRGSRHFKKGMEHTEAYYTTNGAATSWWHCVWAAHIYIGNIHIGYRCSLVVSCPSVCLSGRTNYFILAWKKHHACMHFWTNS